MSALGREQTHARQQKNALSCSYGQAGRKIALAIVLIAGALVFLLFYLW